MCARMTHTLTLTLTLTLMCIDTQTPITTTDEMQERSRCLLQDGRHSHGAIRLLSGSSVARRPRVAGSGDAIFGLTLEGCAREEGYCEVLEKGWARCIQRVCDFFVFL